MSLALSRHFYFVERSDDGQNFSLHQTGLRSQATDILYVKKLSTLDSSYSPIAMTGTKEAAGSSLTVTVFMILSEYRTV